jgi:glutamine synthetase
MERIRAEYIWIDGKRPTAKLRSKTKIIDDPKGELAAIPKWIFDGSDPKGELAAIPEWSFDGSSTYQAEGHFSDCFLWPVAFFKDPIRGGQDILVMCEVMNPDGTPHISNTRARLREIVQKYANYEPLFGMEQEYTLYDADGDRPLRWPKGGSQYPAPQGRYYCGVGCDEVFGRELVEAHTEACLRAGIAIAGTNFEVMPAQAEFQIGPLGALEIGDALWVARWLLYRLGENFGISAKLSPKPIAGDWNGAGCHTNFSIKAMREEGGLNVIEDACRKLRKFHVAHIAVYGADNHLRLTGRHETCPIDDFRWGVGDRGASIRIPISVSKARKGYLEDRRPAANIDPYKVAAALIETVCGKGFVVPDGWSDWIGWDEYILRGIAAQYELKLANN